MYIVMKKINICTTAKKKNAEIFIVYIIMIIYSLQKERLQQFAIRDTTLQQGIPKKI